MASVKSMIAAGLLAAPCADAFVAPGASHAVTSLRGSTAVKAESSFSTYQYSALAVSATTGAAVMALWAPRSRLPARPWLASSALRHRLASLSPWDSLIRPVSARTRLPLRICEPRSSSTADWP
ncbi:rio2 [Symbiodinium necroappetens]|uniref:Rio2 protein n=1 Tax=Symbiodinium necroappetens TaxID=1628268 RepID=A0A812Z8S9_9DINO|nr:rio2 [Symbiodinium necroappetens]